MTKQKRRLSRDLNTLLAGTATTALAEPSSAQGEKLKNLAIDLIQPGKYQPRRTFEPEALGELSESIRAQGIIQPIVVRPVAGNRYEIIAGERRWRAAQLAQLSEVPVIVRELSDNDTIAVALIENIQREDLNPLEEGRAFQRLIDEFDMTHQEIADAVGRSRAGVTNFLRLLTLETQVAKMLEHGDIEMGHAKVLLALKGAQQIEAAQTVAQRGLSVRQTEELVKSYQGDKTAKPKNRPVDPDIRRLQQGLSDKLGATVKIDCNDKGRGKITIDYTSLDQLEGILAQIES